MSRYFPTDAECGQHLIFGKIPIRTFAGEQMQISIVDIPLDGVIDWHSHFNEQMGFLVEGRALFYIGDEMKELAAGDIYFMPSGVKHKVVAVGVPAKAIDIFYPIRDEYR